MRIGYLLCALCSVILISSCKSSYNPGALRRLRSTRPLVIPKDLQHVPKAKSLKKHNGFGHKSRIHHASIPTAKLGMI